MTAAEAAARRSPSVEAWQRDIGGRRGRAFVHAADEFYLLAGAERRAGGAPEQYENGVGIAARR